MVLREQHHRHVFTAPGPPATRMSNAQITLFGHSTDSQAHDQLAAHNGGSSRVIAELSLSLSVTPSADSGRLTQCNTADRGRRRARVQRSP